jgi:hypothetical protein
MREDHDRRRMAQTPGRTSATPAGRSHVAHRIYLHAVVQAHKVNALVVVAVPAIAHGSFAETLLVLHAIVDEIVLARNVEDLADLEAS